MLLKKGISSTVLDLKFNSMTYRFSLWFWLRAGLSVSPPWNWAASFPLLEMQVGYSVVVAGGPLAKVLFQPCLHWKPDVLSSPFDWRLSAFLEEKYQMSSSLSLRLKWKFSWGRGERETSQMYNRGLSVWDFGLFRPLVYYLTLGEGMPQW